jgi:NADPH2:quinone reductase
LSDGLARGDRIATFGPERGAYATARLATAASFFKLPDDIDDETAAGGLLKGCTVEFLVERCARVERGWPVLVQAGGGRRRADPGTMAEGDRRRSDRHCRQRSEAELARAAGADHIILYRDEDVPHACAHLPAARACAWCSTGSGARHGRPRSMRPGGAVWS